MIRIVDEPGAYEVHRDGKVIGCAVLTDGGEWLSAALIYGCQVTRHRGDTPRADAVQAVRRAMVLDS